MKNIGIKRSVIPLPIGSTTFGLNLNVYYLQGKTVTSCNTRLKCQFGEKEGGIGIGDSHVKNLVKTLAMLIIMSYFCFLGDVAMTTFQHFLMNLLEYMAKKGNH